jgi:protein-tyrosine phosphatase
MDITWLTTDGFTMRREVPPATKSKIDRIAVGGGIWTPYNMSSVAGEGITHIIDMQVEFDDEQLGPEEYGIKVLWNKTEDDFDEKPAHLFAEGVGFATAALEDPTAKVFIHCAAGVHRAPMMALAVLGSMGWTVDDAMDLIELRRPVADFAEVYVRSVEKFLDGKGK